MNKEAKILSYIVNTVAVLILIIITVSILVFTFREPVKTYTGKFDYYMQLDDDTIYLIDKKGDTIHREQMNWDKPNQLQQSLINDNL